MSRKTVQNNIYTDELWSTVNDKNKELLDEFLDYLNSIDRSDGTISQYRSDLKGFLCYYANKCNNKEFFDIKKRDVIKYQNYLLNTLELSPSRIRRLKSSLSSLSNFIESILDEDYPDFRNIINKIQHPANVTVREKTILTTQEVKNICEGFVEQGKYREACYFAVLASSGARKSEAFRIKVSDFSDENKIGDALYKTPLIKTKGRGKKGKMLHKYLLIVTLEPYLSLWLEEKERLGIINEYLFSTPKGVCKPSSGDYWCSLAEKFVDKPVYSHSLRHHIVTYMSENNIPSNIIQDYIGWTNIDQINTYDDSKAEDSFTDFFKKDGIVSVDNKGINDL